MSIFKELGLPSIGGKTAPLAETITNRTGRAYSATGGGGKQSFYISFYDRKDQKRKHFKFPMLPAIEPISMRGGGGVPEVKPGIVSITSLKHKNFVVPGCNPIVQTVGVMSTVHQLTGAFIGTERITDVNTSSTLSLSPIYKDDNKLMHEGYNSTNNAIYKAKLFEEKVVHSGSPIILFINSDANYKYEGVVINFKVYAVRADRAYYTLEVLGSMYSKPPVPVQMQSNAGYDGILAEPVA